MGMPASWKLTVPAGDADEMLDVTVAINVAVSFVVGLAGRARRLVELGTVTAIGADTAGAL
jgi:hypothetical protein